MRILARLVLALVIAMSIPMTHVQAACHSDVQASAKHDGGHHRQEPAKAPAGELCMGCIAPATLHPPALGERVAATALPATTRLPTAWVGASIRPATPPPRLG